MSDQTAMPGQDKAQKDAWVARVLGVTIQTATPGGTPRTEAPGADPNRLAGANVQPSTNLRSALAAAARRTPVPEDDDELQDNLAALAPAFLAATMDEPEMSASPLAAGAPIPEQDRMTDIAGLLDSVGRKLDQWDAALAEAEAAKSSLSGPESGGETDAATHESYDESRAQGESLMAEVEALFDTIREQCRTFENAGGAA